MKLLLVEDDSRVSAALGAALSRHGFAVACGRTGAEALSLVADEPDAILLDLNLPDMDGFTICTEIRRTRSVPIIMVTSRSDFGARVQGLNLGADDYLVKPFNLAELIARIHAVTRRHAGTATAQRSAAEPAAAGTLVLGRLRVDVAARLVTVDGRPVPLSRKECDLLMLLAGRPGVVFRREHIIAEVWRSGWQGYGRTLEVHVASLRQKLGLPGFVATVRGVGYRLETPAATAVTADHAGIVDHAGAG
jgi:DNA-binding response OmpR family regulator